MAKRMNAWYKCVATVLLLMEIGHSYDQYSSQNWGIQVHKSSYKENLPGYFNMSLYKPGIEYSIMAVMRLTSKRFICAIKVYL